MYKGAVADPDLIAVEGTSRTFSRRRVLVVLLLPLAMSLMAVSAINVALPTIESGLGASASDIQWVLSGYALAFGISLIPAGRLGDAKGRGGYFVLGVIVFTLASLLCGLAANPLQLNIVRLFQGVGSGLIGPQTTGMILQYFEGQARARAFSLFGLVVSASVAVGPVLSGWVIDAVGTHDGWRAAFLLNVPLGLVTLGLALAWLPFESERMRRAGRALGVKPPHADLDPVGAALISLSVLGVMIPFMTRGNPLVWIALPVGLALLVVWAFWERHYAQQGREPMVPLSLFLYKSFSYGTAVSATQFLGGTSVFVVLAIFVQQDAGASALMTGLIGLPTAAVSAYFSLWAGRRVFTAGRRIVIMALGAFALAMVGLAALAPFVASGQVHFLWLSAPLVLMGVGVGCYGAPNQTMAMEDVPVRWGGSAGAVKQTGERTATAIGNAILTSIFFGVAAGAGLTTAFITCVLVIAVIITCAMLLAVADLRSARKQGKTH